MKRHLALVLSVLFFVVAIVAEISSKAQAADESSPQISLSGELRTRLEDVSTPNFQSRETVLMRTRLNLDAKLVTNTRVYVSLQDSRMWGQEANTVSTGNEGQAVDLSQAWFQVDKLFGQPLSVKVGRQVLAYGDQRLIGHLEWTNNARRFDAAKLMYDTKDLSADLFYSKTAEGLTNPATGTPPVAATERDSFFSGLYATVKSIQNNTIDLYVLNDRNDTSKKDEFTYGARVNGKVAAFDYTGELALQSGDFAGTKRQEAHAYAVKAGYTIPSAMNLRIGAEYDFATGADSTSGKNKAFDNLYPTNHYLYGFTDDVNWSNIKALSACASVKPTKDLWVGAEYWDYQSEKASAKGDNLGSEFNVMVRYSVNANVKLEGTWARRTAGAAGGSSYSVGGTGSNLIKDGDSSDLLYLQAMVTF